MSLPTLRVELDGPTARGGRAFLNGHDITDGLVELDIAIRHDDITRARIELGVGRLEVDAQTLAILQASVTVKERAADEPDLRTFGEEPAHA